MEKSNERRRNNYRNIGKDIYSFDLEHEILIYEYLCMYKLSRRKRNKLKEQEKFQSFLAWEQYICNKYKDYDNRMLLQFEKYLNRGLIGVRPQKEYWNIACAATLTLLLDSLVDRVLPLSEEISELNIEAGVVFISILITLLLFICFISKLVAPIWEKNVEEYFYKDYIEIIKKMRESK